MALEDSAARRDWGWKHEYDLSELVQAMLTHITAGNQLAQANWAVCSIFAATQSFTWKCVTCILKGKFTPKIKQLLL